MSESVGAISLDLVIKSQIEKQLNGIKEKISSTMTKPVEQVSKTISDTMSNAMSKVKKSTESTGNAMAKSMKESADKSKVAWEEHKNAVQGFTDDILKGIETRESKINKSISDGLSVDKAVNNAKKSIESISDVKIKTPEIKSSWGYDPDAMKFMDDYAKKINETSASAKSTMKESVQSISEEMKKELGNFEISEDPTERLKKNLELTQEKMGLLNAKWQELQTSLSQQENENGLTKITSQLNTVESQMLSLQNSADKTKEKIANSSGMDKYKALQEKNAEQIKSIREQNATKIQDIEEKNAAKIQSIAEQNSAKIQTIKEQNTAKVEAINEKHAGKIKNIQEKSFKDLKKSSQKATNAVDKGFSKNKKSANALGKSVNSLGKSIKRAIKSTFLMAGLYAMFRGVRSAISSAATGNEEFANSLNEVKGNLSVAFTPIANAVMPMLNTLMSGLAKVTASVASFISGIFGTTYKKSLEATKQLKATKKEADKTAKSKYLASFDEMNVAQDTSSEGSSGSDGNGADLSKLDINGNGADLSKLDINGNKSAEKLGETIRKKLSAAFDVVGKKAKAVFKYLGGWATKNFAPTFKGIWDNLKDEGEELKGILGNMFADLSTLGAPLLSYFEGPFTTYLQTVFSTLGNIATGRLDTFNLVFSDIWDIAVFPILDNFINVALPMLTEFATEMWLTLDTLFASVKEIFDTLWTEAISPILEFISQGWIDVMNILSEFWNTWGVPIFEGIREALEKTKDTFLNIWDNILKPIFDKFMSVIDDVWNNHIKPLLANFMDFVGELVSGALKIYNKVILPIVNWLVEKLGPAFKRTFETIANVVSTVIKSVIGVVNGIITTLKGIVQFIVGIFTGDWKKAWEGIKNIFKGIWDGLVAIVKLPINLIIDLINGMVSGAVGGVNAIIKALNKLSWKVPDWVPAVGGKTFGFDINEITPPQIPKLAKGGLATAPTLAMVGDNKNAKADPEVIAPLSKLKGMLDNGNSVEVVTLLKQILEYLQNMNLVFNGNVDKNLLFRVIAQLNKDNIKRTGVNVFG